jgi:prepilin-type N-terminal cleavage/methylation domain-containing protein
MPRPRPCAGFTFVEIMVTLVILSLGIVAIFRGLFTSLDQISHLNSRLYVNTMLDDRLARIERSLRAYKALPFELEPEQSLDLGVKSIVLTPSLNIAEVMGLNDIYRIDVAYSWLENGKTVRLSRSAFISDYVPKDTSPPTP